MEGKTGIYDIAEICRFHGVETAVLCPGSRCAPLTLAFSRMEGIRCMSVVDERSAAFIALGIAETTARPVVLICTSGSAVLNFGPALAEAFYRNIPLLVITADRPLRLVGQQDGQTMNQPHVYANFICGSFHVDGDITSDAQLAYLHRTVNAALIKATSAAAGPVHVNISFEEPLYKLADSNGSARFVTSLKGETERLVLWQSLEGERCLILVGSRKKSEKGNALLQDLGKHMPVLAEAVSNVAGETVIANANEMMRTADAETKKRLAPDVLVTIGQGIVSKNLKIFLRSHKPKRHIHIDPSGEVIDTYQALTHVIAASPDDVLGEWFNLLEKAPDDTRLVDEWDAVSKATATRLREVVSEVPFGDLKAMSFICARIPEGVLLHVANSMPVRYLNIFSGSLPTSVEVFCNRGTSGIDGSISTAVGNAIGSGKPTWVITGDLSFQYDGNALWNHEMPAGLRIIIINNSGGGIFRLIDGPSSVPELTERFETRIQSTAKHKAAQYGLEYFTCDSEASLADVWASFAAPGDSAKILEVYTDPMLNESTFKTFQQQLSKNI